MHALDQRVNRKIARFSAGIGGVAVLLTVLVWAAAKYPSLDRSKRINQDALSKIKCVEATCDPSAFLTDPHSDEPDYIIDLQTRYLICAPAPSAQSPETLASLDYSETAFIRQFRKPASYNTPDGEVWRLYSRQTNVGGKDIEVFVGYRERAPSRMVETPPSQIGTVDAERRREAAWIAESRSDGISVVRGARGALSADGFEVVDARTGQVVEWGPWLPAFLSKEAQPPRADWQPVIFDNSLYIVLNDTDATGRLLATSLVEVGNLWWVGGSCLIAFFTTTVVADGLGRRFLRGYFVMTGTRVPSLGEAQQGGEGQTVEFKRGLSADEGRTSSVDEELLKSVAAFANTNDGVIFVGGDDGGHIKGLGLDFSGKDRFERKIRQLVRHRVRPTPPIQITFEEVRGLVIARIVVARGEAPAHLIGGVVYVRDGSSDVQAQPEDLTRLFPLRVLTAE